MRLAKLATATGGLLLALSGSLPALPQEPVTRSNGAQRAPHPEERVDINHASLEELMKVPGMTRSWAARIVRFRPYRTKVDLIDHGVVDAVVYNRIKDYVIAHREKP